MNDLTEVLRAPNTVRLASETPSTPDEVERERARVMKSQERSYKRLFKKILKDLQKEQISDRKSERERASQRRKEVRDVRRQKRVLTRERLSGATSLVSTTRVLLGNRPEASRNGQIRTADGRTSFHFDLTTVSKNVEGKHSAVAHSSYIARASAVAKLQFTNDPQAREAARLVGYASREEAVATGLFVQGTNDMEPEDRAAGRMMFGSIGRTRAQQEAYWHAVAASERIPTRARFLPKTPIIDDTEAKKVVNRYQAASLYAEWDKEAKAYALVPPDNVDKRVLAKLMRQLKADLGGQFIRPRGGLVQLRLIMGLPHELSPEAMLNMCDEFTEILRKDNLPYFGAIHKPEQGNNPLNWHVHLAFHNRPAKIVETAEGPMWDFEVTKRDVRNGRNVHPLKQAKARWISDRETPARLRKLWCDLANKHLAAAGVEKRWFAERYEEVGIQTKALKRLPQKVYAMEMNGVQTKAGRERIRQEQAQSADRRKALKDVGVAKAQIDEQEQIAIKATDQATRLLVRRAALKREIAKREKLLQSNSARDAEKLRARLTRDREALKIVNAMLAEIDGWATPGGKARTGPFNGLTVQRAFAPRDGLAASWEGKRIAFAPTSAEIADREHHFRDHPDGEVGDNQRRTGDNIADRQLARLKGRFATSADEGIRMAIGAMKARTQKPLAYDAEFERAKKRTSARLIATANEREIEILAAVTGLSPDDLCDPVQRKTAIDDHVQRLYRAERASRTLVKEGLTSNTFENGSLGETAPEARLAENQATIVSQPSIASTPNMPSVAQAAPVEPAAPVPTAPKIPSFDQFRERVFQDWTNAFLSYRTNPDREKKLDRVFVENTIARALDMVEGVEPMLALRTARDHNLLDAKRLDPEAKRALYESAAFEASKIDPNKRVLMERLAMAGEIVNRAKKIENEAGTFYRVQKDLAFALAEPVYAQLVGDEITRYARGDLARESFDTAPKRDYRHTDAEATQYDARQRDLYVDIPVSVFRDRLDNLRNSVIELPREGRAAHQLFLEADRRFKAYVATKDVSMLQESPGLTPGVIPASPPGEERAINMMRKRRNLDPISVPETTATDAAKEFLAPEDDGSTLKGPADLAAWANRKFASMDKNSLLKTSETDRRKALDPYSPFTRTLATYDVQMAYKALGVKTASVSPNRKPPAPTNAPRMAPLKPRGLTL